MRQTITVRVANVAAGTPEDWDIPWVEEGTWVLKTFGFAPDGAFSASATNYAILTVETMDVVANLAACTGTITSATVAFVVGTARSVDLTGTACTVSEGDTIRIAKTEAGTGADVFGAFSLVLEKVP